MWFFREYYYSVRVVHSKVLSYFTYVLGCIPESKYGCFFPYFTCDIAILFFHDYIEWIKLYGLLFQCKYLQNPYV